MKSRSTGLGFRIFGPFWAFLDLSIQKVLNVYYYKAVSPRYFLCVGCGLGGTLKSLFSPFSLRCCSLWIQRRRISEKKELTQRILYMYIYIYHISSLESKASCHLSRLVGLKVEWLVLLTIVLSCFFCRLSILCWWSLRSGKNPTCSRMFIFREHCFILWSFI